MNNPADQNKQDQLQGDATPPISESAPPPIGMDPRQEVTASSPEPAPYIPNPDNNFAESQPDAIQQIVDQDQTSETIVSAEGNSSGGGSKNKRVFALLGLFVMIGGIAAGVFLIGSNSLTRTQAWDCSLYNFNVDKDGKVTVRNESTRNEPPQDAEVFINGQLVATLDVPEMPTGSSREIGTVEVPADGFTWKVDGSADCVDEGTHQFQLTCPLSPDDGILVDFTNSKRIRSDQDQVAAIAGPINSTVGSGTYSVTLASFDREHPTDQFQPNEQWFVQFNNSSGGTVAESNSISDLPDSDQFLIEKVNSSLSLSQDATSLTAVHSAYPDTTSPNSVQPVCVLLTPVEEISAQCNDVKAYDSSWTQLTLEDLQSLKSGDVVRFAVDGTATSGSFLSARFSINGETPEETTTKRPGTDEFYIEYEIPEDSYQFSITAEIEHSELGWL